MSLTIIDERYGVFEIRSYLFEGGYKVTATVNDSRNHARWVRNEQRKLYPDQVIWEVWVGVA